MKYAIYTPLDQTIGWITKDGAVTTWPAEAHLFGDRKAAEDAADVDQYEYIEEVPDEEVFRAQAPSWYGRPFTARSLFGLARVLAEATQSEHTPDLVPEIKEEIRALFSASWALLEKLGHLDPKDWWVFGPAPTPPDPPDT